MRYVTVAEMRAIDEQVRKTTCRFPDVPEADHLIKVAAHGIVNLVLDFCCEFAVRPSVIIVFGNGHNGADALYAGWELAANGFAVKYYAVMAEAAAKGTVKRLAASERCHPLEWFDTSVPWTEFPPSMVPAGTIIIDGVLGVGLSGAPREAAASAIRWMNRLKGRARIISVDIPSGLDAESGTAAGDVVVADLTVCMGFPKRGMAQPSALQWCGSIDVNNLEMSPDLWRGEADHMRDELIGSRDVEAWLPARQWDAHKGDFGHVCIVGGAPGYCGAPALAARGALRAGAGLVSAIVPVSVAKGICAQLPEAMVHTYHDESVSAFSLEQTRFDFSGKIVVVGPGLSQRTGVREAVEWLLSRSDATGIVLDADALNVLCGNVAALLAFQGAKIMTPHPGEAARLLGTTVADVQADRAGAVKKLVELTGAVVILKGAGTVVSAPGWGVHLVACVNPGMARGGMGDVLAGIVGALLARGLSPFEAACAAAWLHARAGDRVAWRMGREAMLASDVADACWQ